VSFLYRRFVNITAHFIRV